MHAIWELWGLSAKIESMGYSFVENASYLVFR